MTFLFQSKDVARTECLFSHDIRFVSSSNSQMDRLKQLAALPVQIPFLLAKIKLFEFCIDANGHSIPSLADIEFTRSMSLSLSLYKL